MPADSMPVDKSERRIRRMFGQIAPWYDILNHLLSCGIDIAWRRKTVRTVSPEGTSPILDVCTGTGDLAFGYWKQGRKRIPVVGTDFTHQMLEIADRKRDRLVHRNKRRAAAAAAEGDTDSFRPPIFLEADTLRLPFPDDTFQIVSVGFGLRNVTDTDAGLKEMIRVCQSGGRVAVLEFSMPDHPIIGRLYRFYFQHILPRIGQKVSDSEEAAYNYLPKSVAEFPQGEALAERMRAFGLETVSWNRLTFGIATLYCGKKPHSQERPLPDKRDRTEAKCGI